MDASFRPHQTQTPNSSSTSLSYPLISINADDQNYYFHYNDDLISINADDQNYYFHYNDDLYYNPNSNTPPRCIDPVPFPPSCQDSCYTNIPTYFTTNNDVLHQMTTAADTSESSCIPADTTCLPETNHFHDNVLVGDKIDGESTNDGAKIVLRVKTKLEVLDDGYRWRKYGKKKVKSSPNLRNYYKCSKIGCKVKKRVERDRDDSNYVMATYIGIHNHEVPSHIPCSNCVAELQTSQFS